MAEGSGSTGVVAIVAILVIVAVAAFFAWQGGMLGGGGEGADLSLEANVPTQE